MHTSAVTGKSYIGVTSKTWEERWAGHCRSAREGSQYHFHRAITAYGPDAWTHVIIEENIVTATAAMDRERALILQYRTFEPEHGYNLTLGGEGCSCNDETRRRLSCALRGNEKLRAALTGRKLSTEHRKKIGDAKRGTKHSDETRAKLSESHRGPRSPRTEETKQKLRDAMKRSWQERRTAKAT
jgi:group I intron endonuclease